MLELDDLVYTYPDYNDENIQTLLTAKEEFREVSALTSEPVPKRGELYRHQKFIKRLMLQYDNQMLMHVPGAGKTCSVLSVTQHYKNLAGALEEMRTSEPLVIPYKRAYVLVKGQNLIDEFKYQLVCKCTAGEFITEQILKSKTEIARKANITRSVSKYYTIQTYGAFAKDLLDLTDEQLQNEYNNSIFIVDEIHNINDDKTGGILKENDKGNKYYVTMKKNKKTGEVEEKIIESRLIYDQLWRVFHLVSPRKVLLLSATPMINDASEIGPRLNLILPVDNQIPSTINYNTVTQQTLEPYFRGLISYVRSLDTGAIPVYQGEILDANYIRDDDTLKRIKIDEDIKDKEIIPAQMVVYASRMHEKQAKVYKQAVDDPLSLRPDSKKPGAFSDLQRQVANFIFPDDSTGSVGYKKYVIENGNNFTAKPELYKWISSPEKLNSLSTKFYEIIRLCKEEPGNCWCYSDYIRGSGAVVLGLCFDASGFERFNESKSIFSSSGTGGLAPLCDDSSKTIEKNRFIRISKKLRYALLTSETSGPEASALLEAFNSYENRHGEYIKAVIGSPVTRDGLNLANVLQIHLAGPGWNQASSYQAESRAIRSTSHVDLIKEEKERLRSLGLDDSNAFITIKVYRHAAINDQGTSVDIEMYQLSEIKDREIKRIMRMMKSCATDCQINYARNVRPNDIDYSATCDYDKCTYVCVSPPPTEIDTSSYDVLYSGDIIENIKEDIISIFRVVFLISFETLYFELSSYRRKFIDLAVSDLIENKIPIIDRYGYTSYLREDHGTLFVIKEYPIQSRDSLSISEYTSNLIAISSMTLNEYNGYLQRGIGNILDILTPENFTDTINNLTLENRIMLLENAISSYYIAKEQTDMIIAVIDKFRNNVFILFEPIPSLEISKKSLLDRGKGRGRKPKEGTKFRLTEKQEEQVEEAFNNKQGKEVIYFHNLYSSSGSLSVYDITAKSRKIEGKIRLLKPSEKIGWRDANEYEEVVYNAFIKKKSTETTQQLAEFKVYGTILEDGNFRIIDKTTEDSELATKDARKINRGRICINGWKRPELFQLLWKIKYNPFTIDIEYNRDQLIDYVSAQKIASRDEVETYSDEKLRFFYTWIASGVNRLKICELLQKYFEETGRLMKS